MEGDELAPRRQGRAARPPARATPAVRERAPSKAGKRPPIWTWFLAQHAHTDQTRADAVRAVKTRWPITDYTDFGRIGRVLAREESEHLVGFQKLMDEYRRIYEVDVGDEQFARQTGISGDLLPVRFEMCLKCSREAIPGTGLCRSHGGQWISEEDRQLVSNRIRDRLITASETAVHVLQDLMDNARSELVRLQAANSVLEKAGITGKIVIEHQDGGTRAVEREDAAAVIRERLERLAVSSGLIEAHDDEPEPEEAEVIG